MKENKNIVLVKIPLSKNGLPLVSAEYAFSMYDDIKNNLNKETTLVFTPFILQGFIEDKYYFKIPTNDDGIINIDTGVSDTLKEHIELKLGENNCVFSEFDLEHGHKIKNEYVKYCQLEDVEKIIKVGNYDTKRS